MHTGTTNVTFKHFGILKSVSHQRVGRCLSRLQFGDVFDGIPQVQLFVRDFIRHQLCQTVGLRERKFLYTGNVFDSQFGSHRTICDDMRYFFLTIFIGYPAKHFTTTVVIEVHIDIGQGDTVRIQETLEQQVVLDRVDLGDTQTVSHCRTGSRTTSGPYRYAQFRACGIDEVLHYQEVSGETHRFHDVQLEVEPFFHFFRQRVAIYSFRTVKC